MYICIFQYVYIYTGTYVYTHIYIRTFAYTHTHILTHVHTCTYVHTHIHIHIYTHMRVRRLSQLGSYNVRVVDRTLLFKRSVDWRESPEPQGQCQCQANIPLYLQLKGEHPPSHPPRHLHPNLEREPCVPYAPKLSKKQLVGRKGHDSIFCDSTCQDWLHQQCAGQPFRSPVVFCRINPPNCAP